MKKLLKILEFIGDNQEMLLFSALVLGFIMAVLKSYIVE